MIQPVYQYSLKLSARHRLISAETERKLIVLMRCGADGARVAQDRLVNGHLRFVISVARMYAGRGLPMEDLVNEGCLGLVRAARRFDPAYKDRFISYAVWWIRQGILMALKEQVTNIKVPGPSALKHALKTAQDAARKYPSEKNAARVESVIAKNDAIHRLRNMESVDMLAEVGREPVDVGADPYRDTERKNAAEVLDGLLAVLEPVDQDILRWHYGLGGTTPETLDEVGNRLGLTRERIRQRRGKALLRLGREAQRRKVAF